MINEVAIAIAGGVIIESKVSKFSGIAGNKNIGKLLGRDPISETVRRSNPNLDKLKVKTRIQMSGDGIVFVTFGKR